jgi:hypothetical protein
MMPYRTVEHAVRTGLDPKWNTPRLDGNRERIVVIIAGSKVLQKVKPSGPIPINYVKIAVTVEVADAHRRVAAKEQLRRFVEDLCRVLGLVSRRTSVYREEPAAGGSIHELLLMVAVEIAGCDGDPIVVKNKLGPSTRQGSRFHQDRWQLSSKTTIHPQEPAMIGDEELDTAPTTPCDRHRRGV